MLFALAAGSTFARAGVADFLFEQVVTGPTLPGSAPFAKLHMVDNGAGNVDFTLTNLFSSSDVNQKDIFITELLLNVAGGPTGLTIDSKSPSAKFGSVGIANNGFVDASYKFDVDMHFTTNGANGGADRIKAGQSVTFSAHASGLSVSSFNTPAEGAGAPVALLHVQGLPGGASAKLAPTPEPASMAVIAVGVVGLVRRRRKN